MLKGDPFVEPHVLDRLPTVLTSQEILDKAFARAAKIDIYDPVRYHRIRKTESARLAAATDLAADTLARYPSVFGSMDRMRDYHREILDILVGEARLRKALGSLSWSVDQIRRVGKEAQDRISRVRKRDGVDPFFQARKVAYGRISSIVEEVGPALEVIAEARAKVKALPTVSPDYATVVIAGYPNVGKTSLLRAWTDSRAEVNQYAFTTKQAEVGHFEVMDSQDVATKIQVVDTPGLLDRPEADRNDIERQALAALRYVADAVLFIIDPTETCGYDIGKQEALLRQVEAEMAGLPLLVAESKRDMAPDRATPKGRIAFSTTSGAGMADLRERILAALPLGAEPELEEDPLLRWTKPRDDDW